MFVDIVGFTIISKVMTPAQLVRDLDYCFTNFDQIIDRYKIEKIKTMGDAYICVAGLDGREDHPIRMVQAAQDLLSFSESWKKERQERSEPPYNLRIGIHSGSIIAGVVGVHKFAFDIWGDAVNVAARLEAASEMGKINISENTFRRVRDQFNCTSRGKMAIKNAGEIEMYFVEKELS
ncbi:MAG: adenylate/guanylate cyclase domain-containing protein [Bacteroidota bacterium]